MRRVLAFIVAVFAGVAVAQAQPRSQQHAPAQAQEQKGPPNALQGFSQNRDEPVHIDAASLVVRDKDKIATFSGDVHVKQGDTDMRCKSLVVFYEQDEPKAAAKGGSKGGKPMQQAEPGPGGNQKIKKLEARGGVIVTQKEQTATGELGIFEMPSNTVTLTGNVVMTQGKNVLRGDKLVVDLTSGVSRVESAKNGHGRVQGLFLPSSGGGMPELKPGGGGPPPSRPGAR